LDYWPLVFVLPLAIIVPLALLLVQKLLAPRMPNARKLQSYECGAPILGTAHPRLPIKFYLTAVLFLLFDIEVVFLFPWAASFTGLGGIGLATMLIFLGVLEIGLLYVWRKGALEWE
jgi:NADH-quinone oxidoreductase subunit A